MFVYNECLYYLGPALNTSNIFSLTHMSQSVWENILVSALLQLGILLELSALLHRKFSNLNFLIFPDLTAGILSVGRLVCVLALLHTPTLTYNCSNTISVLWVFRCANFNFCLASIWCQMFSTDTQIPTHF